MRIALVGGTGFSAAEGLPIEIETPWGDVHARLDRRDGIEWLLVARHAAGHAAPPHRVAHRANVAAIAAARADWVIALNAVGGVDPALRPGSLVVPHDWLDLAHRADGTFHDDAPVHVDVTEPYCPTLRRALAAAAGALELPVVDGGVMAVTAGPRFETPAEVRAMRAAGATIVGMTGLPEAALAREKGLCYASLALVVNAAAGIGPPLSARDVAEAARAQADAAQAVACEAARRLPVEKPCACGRGLAAARLR